jgi:hypothetical protein
MAAYLEMQLAGQKEQPMVAHWAEQKALTWAARWVASSVDSTAALKVYTTAAHLVAHWAVLTAKQSVA